jgi:hypothetical protein
MSAIRQWILDNKVSRGSATFVSAWGHQRIVLEAI